MSTQLADGIHMIVETEGEDLNITEGSFTPQDKVILIQYLVTSLSKMSKIPHNEILDDLKITDEWEDKFKEEPITEARKVKKKKKERK